MNQTGPDVVPEVVRTLADLYRRQGYRQSAVPASLLLAVTGTREVLETALGVLLDAGGVMATGNNGVTLHPSARSALLSRSVLEGWQQRIAREEGSSTEIYRDGMARELAELVAWAVNTTSLPDDLTQRGAELAGVLATIGLDPRAMDVVTTHGGTPRSRLVALAAVRQRTLSTDQLLGHLRHTVSTAYPGR